MVNSISARQPATSSRDTISCNHDHTTPISKLSSARLSHPNQNPSYCRVQSSPIQKIWYMGCAIYKYHEYLFLELSVYTEAIINVISPSSSTFSTITSGNPCSARAQQARRPRTGRGQQWSVT